MGTPPALCHGGVRMGAARTRDERSAACSSEEAEEAEAEAAEAVEPAAVPGCVAG